MSGDLNDAIAHYGAGRQPQAKEICQKILPDDADYPKALSMLGVIAFAAGETKTALKYLAQAITAKPDYAEAHNNLGNLLRDQGRLAEAEDSYRRALDLKPEHADFHNNLGVTLNALGRLQDAVASCRKAISINPGLAEAHNTLGGSLHALGQWEEAAASSQKAITLKPDFAGAFINLGYALNRLGRLDDALSSFHQALALNPDFAEAHYLIGDTSYTLGRLDDALASTRNALVLKPDFSVAARHLLHLTLYLPGLTPEERFAEHLLFSETQTRDITPQPEKLTNDATPDRRLRIGYLSSDFINHPVGTNILPLLSCHERKNFEIFCYADVRRPDALTERLRATAEHWRPIVGMSDADVARMVWADGIDVLVCLAGHFGNNRPLVCAHRAAPVQVSFHDGATSGLAEMDYWLSDNFLHPLETTEKFTEQLYRLPVLYQYPGIEEAPSIEPLAADTNGFITFGSFNNPAKINEAVIDLWAQILKSVAGSRLILKYKNLYGQASLQNFLLERFAADGVNADRIIFETSSDSVSEHLAQYAKIDIALDPFPFNGATTTFQALSMGVPVISLAGDTFIHRAAGSMLVQVDLGDLAVDTPQAYVACAKDLAADLPRLRSLRAGLRDRLAASPLCNAAAYARDVEAAYRHMWRGWCLR